MGRSAHDRTILHHSHLRDRKSQVYVVLPNLGANQGPGYAA